MVSGSIQRRPKTEVALRFEENNDEENNVEMFFGGDNSSPSAMASDHWPARLKTLQRGVLQPNATYLKIQSADGFFEVVALDAIREDGRVMRTYAWDGLPLTKKHGFPLRIYIPDR